MKKSIMIPLEIFLFTLTLFVASFAIAETEVIPSYAMPIMETWNASTGEELIFNLVTYWRDKYIALGEPEVAAMFDPEGLYYSRSKICFDKTTKELIANPKNWDLAITSSQKVDLQKLADAGLLHDHSNDACRQIALHHWLLPEKVQNLIPIHPSPDAMYEVYCYSYNAESEEAIFLISRMPQGAERFDGNPSVIFAKEIYHHRSIADARATEGLSIVTEWSYQDLIEKPQDWDVAILFIPKEEDWDTALLSIEQGDILHTLEQSGILYDFSQDEYFCERTVTWPLPNGVIGTSGQMIGIPFVPMGGLDDNVLDSTLVLLMNSQSTRIPRALEYAKHYVTALEVWYNGQGYKNRMGIN